MLSDMWRTLTSVLGNLKMTKKMTSILIHCVHFEIFHISIPLNQ